MVLLYLFNFYCVSSIEVFHFADIKKEFVRIRSIPRYFFYSCISSCFSQVHKLWRSKKYPKRGSENLAKMTGIHQMRAAHSPQPSIYTANLETFWFHYTMLDRRFGVRFGSSFPFLCSVDFQKIFFTYSVLTILIRYIRKLHIINRSLH